MLKRRHHPKKLRTQENPLVGTEEKALVVSEPREGGLEKPIVEPSTSLRGAWRKVDVYTPTERDVANSTIGDQDETKLLRNNHYDDPSLKKSADRDFEASVHEAPGIFFGLEVLDGNSYRIDEDPKTKRRFMVLKDNFRPHDESQQDEEKQEKSQIKEPAKDNRKRKLSDKTTTCDADVTKSDTKEEEKTITESTEGRDTGTNVSVKSKKKKRKKNQKKEEKQKTHKKEDTVLPLEQVQNLQTAWAAQMGGVMLHENLCASLLRQGFWSPTPIQAAALPPAIMGRRNIVGAAPTGSGKTLAFLLPIGQFLQELESKDDDVRALRALILTPTRELAMQIQSESDKLLGPHQAGTLVGGLAQVKQIRVLEKMRPPIVVATPGRLWEMMSSREHPHLNNLSQVRFLVIDEADRMIQQGSFPQLVTILDAVQRANPMDDDSDAEDADDNGEEGDGDRMFALPGIPGEAKLVMLNDDIMAQIERQRENEKPDGQEPDVVKMDEESQPEALDQADDDDDDDSHQISLPKLPPVYRQTFVYSATLTLPASANFAKRNPEDKKARIDADVDGAIAEILKKSRAKGKTKVVDLSNAINKKAEQESSVKPNTTTTFRLPEGLTLQQIKCTQKHKDSHLYAFLMTTAIGSSGPCLVFCNSIAGVRRVGATMQALGLDVRILHAHMQQRARFKAVELLQESQKRTVVVATDVAARGLDIPSVASVVHYDTARTVDCFIHRSGRTARGVGPEAVGFSVSLVSPDEDKMHTAIKKALNLRFETVAMDGRLLRESQERVSLASKVAEVQNTERKSQRQNQWLKEKAAEADLDLEEGLLDAGLAGGDNRDRATLIAARKAQERLSVILAQPMRTQRFGKFLSTNSALKQDVVVPTPKIPVLNHGKSRKRRRRR